MSNNKTEQETSLPPLSECMSEDSVVIDDHEQAAEFTGLRTRLIELITELSAAVRILEDQPQVAQRLSVALHRSERVLQKITKQYKDVEMLRVKLYLLISLRRVAMKDQDKELQSEIDDYDDLRKYFLQSCRDQENDVRETQKGVQEIIDSYLYKGRLMAFFCSWFIVMVASNFEKILQVARRRDL